VVSYVIPPSAFPPPLPDHPSSLPFINMPQSATGPANPDGTTSGTLSPTAQGQQTAVTGYLSGIGRIIPTNATNVGNVITLALGSSSPGVSGYSFGDAYLFVSPFNSSGSVTANVSTVDSDGNVTGSLATLNVYITRGTAQAGNGDIVAGSLYLAFYQPLLNSNAGGFVLF
jgi:hypothetical protein